MKRDITAQNTLLLFFEELIFFENKSLSLQSSLVFHFGGFSSVNYILHILFYGVES